MKQKNNQVVIIPEAAGRREMDLVLGWKFDSFSEDHSLGMNKSEQELLASSTERSHEDQNQLLSLKVNFRRKSRLQKFILD